MKHSVLATTVAFGLVAVMSSCNKGEEVKDNSHTIEFSSISGHKVFTLDDSAQEFNQECDAAYRDSAAIVMPEVLYSHDISALRDTIMSIAFDTVAPDPAAAMASYFVKVVSESGYSVSEVPDSVHIDDIDGFTLVTGDIYSLTARRLTYRITNETYLPGAAHGMTTCYYITYDLTEGDILTLTDLFTDKGIAALPGIISERARRLQSQLGPTNIDSLPSEGNFFISLDDEIVFVYQPYEVASYAQGLICVPFYPYQLSDYLSPRGLAFFGLNE